MDLDSYILGDCLIVIPVLNLLGMFLKRVPFVPDWSIPFILLAIGIGICMGIAAFGEYDRTLLDGAIQGVLVTGAAVLAHQSGRQLKKRTEGL